MRKGYRFSGLLVCAMTVALWGQQAVAPPPRPTDGGPNLDATLSFLQGRLNGIGKLSFAVYNHDNADGSDWINQRSEEISGVTYSVPDCRLSYHEIDTRDGKANVYDFGVPFKLAEDVVVLPMDQAYQDGNSKAGHPTWTSRPEPMVLVVRVRRRAAGGVNEFYLTDATLADRLAKALTHAIELCGGGNKDPF